MAYDIGVKIGVDGEREFRRSINDINDQYKTLKTELATVTSAFEKNDQSQEKLSKKNEILTKQIELQRKKVEECNDVLERSSEKYGENSKQTQSWQRAVNSATTDLNKLELQLKANEKILIEQSSKWTGLGKALDETGTKINAASNNLLKAGGIMTVGITAPLVALGKTALTTGMDFESAMSRVKAISQATAGEFEKLNTLALKLGQETAFSASEAAAGMENLASAGFSVSEIMDAMPGMLDLAASGGIDIATASDIASSALRSFGLGAEQSGHFADVLAKSAADTNANVTDMGMAMKYAAAPANTLGMSVEEVASAIGVMANAGIKGEQAGTTLRGALLGLASPSGPAADAMAAIGMEVFDATGKMLPFNDVIAEVTESTKDLTQEEKVNALATIFGREAVSGMMVLIENGPEKYDALTQSLIASDGAAKDMAETMQDNAKSSVEQMYGSLETAAIKVETAVAPTIEKLAEGVQDLADDFSNLSPEMQETIIKTVGVAAAIGPLVLGIGGLGKVVTGTIGAVNIGAKAIKTIIGAIDVLTIGAAAATPAVSGLAGAMTLLTGPVGLVIAGVAALTVGGIALHNVIAKGKQLTEEQTKANEEYAASSKAVTDAITTNITERTKSVKTTQDEAMAAADLAKKIFDLSDKQNKSGWEMQLLNSYVTEFNKLMPTANMVIDEQTGALNLTRQATDDLIQSEIERIQLQAINEALVQNAKDQLTTKREMNEAQIRQNQLEQEYAQGMQEIINGTGNANEKQQKANELWSKYQEQLGPVTESVSTLTAKQGELNKENETLTKLQLNPSGWNAFVNGTNEASQAVISFTDGTTTKVSELGTTAPILAKQAGEKTTGEFQNAIIAGVPGVTTAVETTHRTVTQEFNPLPGEMTQAGSGAMAGLGAGIDVSAPIVDTAAQGIFGLVTGKLNPLGAFGTETGGNLASGLTAGMSTWNAFTVATQGIVDFVKNAFLKGFDINSPSGFTTYVGNMLGTGLINSLSNIELGKVTTGLIETLKGKFNEGKISALQIINSIGSEGTALLGKMGINLGITGGGLPVSGDITSYFGYRDDVQGVGTDNHMGIDIGAAEGTPIYAVESGTASLSTGSGYGNLVIIDNGTGLQEYYGHMSDFAISDGQTVKKGDIIGYVGSTGNSTGPHLHFGVLQNGEWVDPLSLYGFDVGSRYVPQDMVAMVHQGEMIIPKSENPYANSKGSITGALQTEAKQPAVINLVLQNGTKLAEYLIDDINNMLGVKTGMKSRGMV